MHRGKLEKAKDFKGSIKRLILELKDFKVLILIALVLACLSSILSILGPSKLSDLTDEIANGLVLKSDNLELITKKITSNLNDEKITSIMPLLKNVEEDSLYDDIVISSDDKITFLKTMENFKNGINDIVIPESIGKILFESFEVDGNNITYKDQIEFLSIMNGIDKENINANELYKKVSSMPSSIQDSIKPFMDIDTIKKIVLFLIILYLLSALFNYTQAILMTTVSNNFAKKLRSNIASKINRLPLKYFDRNQKGDILSRVTNDVDIIAHTMNQSLGTLVSATTLFLGTLIMMFITNGIMAITAIISSLLGFIFMIFVLSKSQKYFVLKQQQLGLLNGHIEEIYSGLNVVKTYNGKKESDITFDELNESMFEANRKSQFLSGLMMPMMGFIGNFGYVAVCIVGALLTMNGKISFGVIVAFISYVRTFTSPLSQIAQGLNNLQSTAAAGERVFEFVDEEEMSNQDNIVKSLDKKKIKGEIEFCDVTFTYDGNESPTIKGFSAKAYPGQKIAIVGPTGAGKTTMVNLLMKFYEIDSGDIKIDGTSINDLTRENIHSLFTMVLQDTWLFEGTVKENIIYNRENISLDKIRETCKTVGVDHFIKTLPNGYDSVIKDDDSVSAGERQLLTIARAMIDSSPFLILDEATSSVDTRTEELVQIAMDKLTKGKTSFIIAHRLSTIKNADLILVMKDGNIIESGNHEELLSQNGFYAELYNSQFQNS